MIKKTHLWLKQNGQSYAAENNGFTDQEIGTAKKDYKKQEKSWKLYYKSQARRIKEDLCIYWIKYGTIFLINKQ